MTESKAMTSNKANDLRITLKEMNDAYYSIVWDQNKPIPSFEEYCESHLKDLADGSHGDVVLHDNGAELKRFKAIYPKEKKFKNPESSKPTAGSYPKAHEKKK